MFSEVILLAAVLIGSIATQTAAYPYAGMEGWLYGLALLFFCGCYGVLTFSRAGRLKERVLERGGWWGADALLRCLATPLALGGGLALAIWAALRASQGEKLGGYGSLLVLLVVVAVVAKLVAETYLFAQIGGEPSPRQDSAQRLVGPMAGWSKLRYSLGAMGGIVLPLGAQLLAGGAKNIPAVVDAGPPAVLALLALLCLVPGELLERWLFMRSAAEPM